MFKTVLSNPVTTVVAQIYSVTVTPQGSTLLPGDPPARCYGFRVTNTGNGPATYALAAFVAQGGVQPASLAIHLDTDGDGVCDPTHDQPYAPGATDPTLQAGQSILVWVIARATAGGQVDGFAPVTLQAAGRATGAATSSPTPAASPKALPAVVNPEIATLSKSQSVLDPNGGARPLPGAIITYRLKAQFTGAATADGVTLSDPIPSGSIYVTGSLHLDGAALSDAADGDAGQVDADGVKVSLGRVANQTEHTVSFQVRINKTGATS